MDRHQKLPVVQVITAAQHWGGAGLPLYVGNWLLLLLRGGRQCCCLPPSWSRRRAGVCQRSMRPAPLMHSLFRFGLQFLRDYVAANKPVILTGELVLL